MKYITGLKALAVVSLVTLVSVLQSARAFALLVTWHTKDLEVVSARTGSNRLYDNVTPFVRTSVGLSVVWLTYLAIVSPTLGETCTRNICLHERIRVTRLTIDHTCCTTRYRVNTRVYAESRQVHVPRGPSSGGPMLRLDANSK